jgi:hypothetical protein
VASDSTTKAATQQKSRWQTALQYAWLQKALQLCKDTGGDTGFVGDILQDRSRLLSIMLIMTELVKLRDLFLGKESCRFLIYKHVMYVCVSSFLGNKLLTTDTANTSALQLKFPVRI